MRLMRLIIKDHRFTYLYLYFYFYIYKYIILTILYKNKKLIFLYILEHKDMYI